MKLIIRRGCNEDLDGVYNLHVNCFPIADCWYKSAIKPHLENGIIIEVANNDKKNKIIGVLLQDYITPCNKKIKLEDQESSEYKEDIFVNKISDDININTIATDFVKNNKQYTPIYGIIMICIDPQYRRHGLAKKLIEKHFLDNENKHTMLCLNARQSNSNACELYKSMGYIQIAIIKNKYFLPSEDSIFMIKNLTDLQPQNTNP